jgi:hypothetical protein
MSLIEQSPHHFAEHTVVPIKNDGDTQVTLQALCGTIIHIETEQRELLSGLAKPRTLVVRDVIELLRVGEPYTTRAWVVANDEADGLMPAFMGIQLDEVLFSMYESRDLYRFVEKHNVWHIFLFLASQTTNFNQDHQKVAQEQGLSIAIPWVALNVSVGELAHYYKYLQSTYAAELEAWFCTQLDMAQQSGFGAFLYVEFLDQLVNEYPDLVEKMLEFFSRVSHKTFVLAGYYGGVLRYEALAE